MASYSVLANESTNQMLSPTVTKDIVYVTILTSPSGVVCSLVVDADQFNKGTAGPLVTSFADNVEQLMGMSEVIGAQGYQQVQPTGLLADNVSFIVQYVPPGGAASAITAVAIVPNNLLTEGGDPQINAVLIQQAEAIITKTYDNLVALTKG